MRWVIALLLVQSTFAVDLFTLDESRRIDKYVQTAVNKKYTPRYLKQIEQKAISKYPLYKIGDKFTANNGGRHYRGTIHKITQDSIQVGSFNFSTKDYPKHYFDKVFNNRARLVYIDRNFKKAKAAYQKRAEDHYKKKLLEKRPLSERPAVVQRQTAVATQKQPINQNFKRPILKDDVKLKLYNTLICSGKVWYAGSPPAEYVFTRDFIFTNSDPHKIRILEIKHKQTKQTNKNKSIILWEVFELKTKYGIISLRGENKHKPKDLFNNPFMITLTGYSKLNLIVTKVISKENINTLRLR